MNAPSAIKSKSLKIAYLTSGAAGMFCGSCLNDNSLARAMIAQGADCVLVPLYTPIRTDSKDVSTHQVFFGGINVYLQQRYSFFRYLPRWLDRWIDTPWIIRLATARQVKITARDLGAMAVSMLKGAAGFQRKEVLRLVDWLSGDLAPDLVVFSNILTAGCVPELKQKLPCKVLVTLQGDDIFLKGLQSPYQEQALQEIKRLAQHIDGFLVHSEFYADAMAKFLGIPREKCHHLPLGIDASDISTADSSKADSARPLTIGYLARLAPEKGLHVLVDAFIYLRRQLAQDSPDLSRVRLEIGGWLGAENQGYAQECFAKLEAAGLEKDYCYRGELDREGKLNLLQSIDVLSVPTTYEEPKGLFILEGLAAGVPYVEPAHGSFPETHQQLGGGLLHAPGDAVDLAQKLAELLLEPERRQQLAQTGHANLLAHRTSTAIAQKALTIFEQVVAGKRPN